MKKHPNKKENIVPLVVLSVAILLCVSIFIKTRPRTVQGPSTTNPVTNSEQATINTTGWEQFNNDTIAFLHPDSASITTHTADLIKLEYNAKSSRTNNEITDGYAVTILKKGVVGPQSLDTYKTSQIGNFKKDCSSNDNFSIDQPKPLQRTEYNSVTFSVNDCFGNHVVTYLEAGRTVYEITETVYGESDESKNYQEITKNIVESLNVK